ncbi:MAG: type IV toxin-antitoxin system AbiEi family antitoxin domain-containing protein, partial [Deltaproteobacteria bacterium]
GQVTSADLIFCRRFCTMLPMDTAKEKAISKIRKQGGIIRTREAFHQGIHRRTLYGLRDDGALISISRGLYQLAEMDSFPTEIDLVNVAKLAPQGVICLISALSFHGLTTQIPHEIWLAVDRKARKPKVTYPPVRAIFFTGSCFQEGMEVHRIMEQEVRIYNAPKTVIDCFRWRNTVGLDVALEAARSYLKRRGASPAKLMEYAKLCKVEKLVTPYLEAMVS